MQQPSETALEFLAELQRQALVDYGLASPEQDTIQLGIEVTALRSRYAAILSATELDNWQRRAVAGIERAHAVPRITPFQDPIDQMLLSNVAVAIQERIAKISNAAVPSKAILASLPIGQMNALTLKLDQTDEYLVLFQRGLFGLLNLVSRLLVAAWPCEAPDQPLRFVATRQEFERELSQMADPGRQLAAVLEHSLIGGNPNSFPVLPLSPARSGMKEAILLNAEIFVLGHEYGHIERGHFDLDRRIEANVAGRNRSLISRSHKEEFAADLSGIEYLTAFGTQSPQELYLSYCGACFFLSCQDLVEAALAQLAGNNVGHRARDTHPTAALRKNAITKALAVQIGLQNANILARTYNDGIQWVLDEMWRLAQPYWQQIANSGAVAHRIWWAAAESHERPDDPPLADRAATQTAESWGMPRLEEMEPFKYPAFLSILQILDASQNDQRQGALYIAENAHIVMFSILSEVAVGSPERREAVLAKFAELSPEFGRWLSLVQFVVDRHQGSDDITGEPEVVLQIMSGIRYLAAIAQRILADEPVDYVRLLFEVEHAIHQERSGLGKASNNETSS
jgi:hypothetical protein